MTRDPKGLYAKSKAGRVQHVTGLDSPYEPPQSPELHLLAAEASAEALAERVVAELERRGMLAGHG
jgi:bifunctional enzyme CysN/CysC